MNRDEFMELVYETFADEPDNVLANGIIEAADAYVEHEKAQLFKEGTTKDAISRQAALDCVTYDVEYTTERIKALPSLQPTCNQLVTDCISRRATIDAVNNAFDRETLLAGFVRSIAVRAIRDMPSVQPEHHWILCDEKMPEEHEWIGTKKFGTTISDEVYVTFENEKGERFCKHLSFQNGKLSSYDQFHMDTWFKGSKPIAWMPLPEAYKPNK